MFPLTKGRLILAQFKTAFTLCEKNPEQRSSKRDRTNVCLPLVGEGGTANTVAVTDEVVLPRQDRRLTVGNSLVLL